MARPPEEDRPRDVRVILRALAEERDAWKRAAAKAGMGLSAWLRKLANDAAEAAGVTKRRKP